MSVTLPTAQSLRSWSKAKAQENMWDIDVTPEVSHAPMSWSNEPAGQFPPM